MKIDNDLPYWLAALHLPGIGPRTVLRWLETFQTIKALFTAPAVGLQAAGLTSLQVQAVLQPAWQMVDADLAWAASNGRHLIGLTDPAYPLLLKEISDPPLVLYVHGDPAVLSQKQLAMVGARSASAAGLQNASQFAGCLAAAGLAVTSGLAKGIDGASHRGALAAKGVTIAVMGTGHHHIYPSAHKSLAYEIAEQGGAVVSEFPLDTLPAAMNFPRRNRIIAGLSQGVLVVEAALKSGSLITARHALEHNREVFAIPGSIHHPLSRGCHYLLRQGAKLVEKADDILEELIGFHRQDEKAVSAAPVASSQDPLPRPCRELLAHVDYAATPIDMILFRSGLTAGAVSSMLLVLELHGYIESVTGGYMRTAAN